MDASVLAVASNAVLDACARLGLDRAALAGAAGVEPGELDDPDARLPVAKADAIWAAAAAAADDPCLALHAAEALPFGAYRVIDFLSANAPSLGDALERVAAYFPLIDPRGRVVFEREQSPLGPNIALTFESADGRPLPAPAVEYTFAALLLRSREGLGIDWRPLSLELTRTPPSPEIAAELARVFGVVPMSAAPRDRMLVSAIDWARANAAGDRGLFEVLNRHAAMLVAELPALGATALIQDLRAAVGAELRGGDPALDRVAGRLGMSGRTLQRRLDDQGLRFGELVDEVRSALAKAYLQDRQMALCEVAFLLGFADQSAFGRAFKRWTGVTPGRWRRA